MKINIKKITLFGLLTAVSMVLSYVEMLLPPILAAVPGVKIGLPNIIIIFVLYKFSVKHAVLVSLLRVVMVTLLFGNAMVFIYSFAGAVLSICIMSILKRINQFSVIGISVLGAVSHNVGQTIVAIIILQTKGIAFYMMPLLISGIVAGILIGILGGLLIKRFKKIKLC